MEETLNDMTVTDLKKNDVVRAPVHVLNKGNSSQPWS